MGFVLPVYPSIMSTPLPCIHHHQLESSLFCRLVPRNTSRDEAWVPPSSTTAGTEQTAGHDYQVVPLGYHILCTFEDQVVETALAGSQHPRQGCGGWNDPQRGRRRDARTTHFLVRTRGQATAKPPE